MSNSNRVSKKRTALAAMLPGVYRATDVSFEAEETWDAAESVPPTTERVKAKEYISRGCITIRKGQKRTSWGDE
jgi:hypothetical protein